MQKSAEAGSVKTAMPGCSRVADQRTATAAARVQGMAEACWTGCEEMEESGTEQRPGVVSLDSCELSGSYFKELPEVRSPADGDFHWTSSREEGNAFCRQGL